MFQRRLSEVEVVYNSIACAHSRPHSLARAPAYHPVVLALREGQVELCPQGQSVEKAEVEALAG